jgi:CheY-like chemotaxis protein
MLHAGRVLVVTDDPETADVWTASLELEGYDTEVCRGPGASLDCPRLHGAQCLLRERADITVVDLDCDEDAVVCTRVPDDGGTLFARRTNSTPIGRETLANAVEETKQLVAHLKREPPLDVPIHSPDLD